MTELKIASVPMLELIQKACETLVVANCVGVSSIYNAADRKVILTESQKLNELIDHLRELIKENQSDSSNPKS